MLGAASFDVRDAGANSVIGAVARDDQFGQFKAAFESRLRRLHAAMTANTTLRKPLMTAINLVADKDNWDGAFAELSAIDYFLADPQVQGRWRALPIKGGPPQSSHLY